MLPFVNDCVVVAVVSAAELTKIVINVLKHEENDFSQNNKRFFLLIDSVVINFKTLDVEDNLELAELVTNGVVFLMLVGVKLVVGILDIIVVTVDVTKLSKIMVLKLLWKMNIKQSLQF